MPVLLHAKGQEAEIADRIKDFPEHICVYWYSGDRKNLERFMELGCCFTLGPDTKQLYAVHDPVRTEMVEQISLDHLFVETDGLEAVAWCRGTGQLPIEAIGEALHGSMACLAKARKADLTVLAGQMEKNLMKFLKTGVHSNHL